MIRLLKLGRLRKHLTSIQASVGKVTASNIFWSLWTILWFVVFILLVMLGNHGFRDVV